MTKFLCIASKVMDISTECGQEPYRLKVGVELHGSGPSPTLHCRRILSKQGMECTPVFHSLFLHSSPLHIYKQSPEEEGKKDGKMWEK